MSQLSDIATDATAGMPREIAPEFLAEESARKTRRHTPIARSVYGDLVQFIDFIFVTVASVAVAYAYVGFVLDDPVDFQRYAAAGIIGATGLTTLLRRDGFYEFDRLLASSRAIRAVIARWSLVILALIAFGFALKVSEEFSRFWLFAWAGVSAATLIASRISAGAILRRAAAEGGVFARRVAIVGATEVATKFAESAAGPDKAVSIVGVFMAQPDCDYYKEGRLPVGDLKALAKAARNGEIDDIVIALPGSSREEMTKLINKLSLLPVSVAICANTHWLDHTGGEIVRIGGAPLLTLYRRPLEGWGGLIKTAEDMILGGMLFLAVSPVLIAIAIGIKLQGKGPVLFTQKRHGFNHEVFRIYKFRTMTVTEDGEKIIQARIDDPRITPLGKILRRYSLDELPQLINVLRGEMSLVGPRPHALAHTDQYAVTVKNYSGRHKVKPGITGWAQVNGFRGETSENEMMEDRVHYDLEYIDNWSLWFDFKILVLTVGAVLFPKNAH